jgi:hypothetical protein
MPATAKPSKWRKFSPKSADSAREKTKKWKKFLFFLSQQFTAKVCLQNSVFFASNAQIRPIMAALIIVEPQLKESRIYEL